MILVVVHRSPGICLTAEENPSKPQLGYSLTKGLCDQSSPQMGIFPPNEVGRIAQHVRKGEGRKEVRKEGRKEARKERKKEGKKEGRKEARKERKKEGKKERIINWS